MAYVRSIRIAIGIRTEQNATKTKPSVNVYEFISFRATSSS